MRGRGFSTKHGKNRCSVATMSKHGVSKHGLSKHGLSKHGVPWLCIGLMLGGCHAQGAPSSASQAPSGPVSFEDDGKRPLDVQDKVIETFPGGALHDLTYASANGDRVGAYLVV